MAIKFIDDLLSKIAEYLPDEEPATEEERLYEEGKKRVYEMHQKEDTLFYAESAWLDGSYGKVYGEVVKGTFGQGDQMILLNAQGNPLMEMELLGFKEDAEEERDINREYKKGFLLFDREKMLDKEDFFVQSYYVVKKH